MSTRVTMLLIFVAAAAAAGILAYRQCEAWDTEAFDPALAQAPGGVFSTSLESVRAVCQPGTTRLPSREIELVLMFLMQVTMWKLVGHLVHTQPDHKYVRRMQASLHFRVFMADTMDASVPAITLQKESKCLVFNHLNPDSGLVEDPSLSREQRAVKFVRTMVRGLALGVAPRNTPEHEEAFAWLNNTGVTALRWKVPLIGKST